MVYQKNLQNQRYASLRQSQVYSDNLNVFGIVFPKPETEIVNQILRLRRAIVDPVQIRSNAISCYLIAVNNCMITKAFSIVNSCMAFYSHILS